MRASMTISPGAASRASRAAASTTSPSGRPARESAISAVPAVTPARASRSMRALAGERRGDLGQPLPQRQGGVRRAERVVLVRDGGAERRDHAVPAHLAGRAAVPVRDRLHRGVAALHHLVEHLRIERRSPCGRAHVGRDADDLAASRPGCRGRHDPVIEDVPLELLELRRRFEAEVVRQPPARVGVRGERVGLAATAVEREHELRAQRLAQRVVGHERLQLADHVRLAAEREVGVDPRSHAHQAQVIEALGLADGELLVADVLQRRAPPEAERVGQQPARGRVIAAGERVAALGGQSLEPLRIHGVGTVEAERVPVRAPDDRLLAQDAAEARHDELERIGGMGGQAVAPQRLDRDVRRHDPRAVHEQHREQPQRASRARQRVAVGADRFDGAEDPELHLPSLGVMTAP